VAWLPPELADGAEPWLKPLELELELEEPVLELELEPDEPADLELDPDGPDCDVAAVWWVEPGSTRATAPAVTTLAMVTAVVAERTFARPCSLAAMASRTLNRCALLMSPILQSRTSRAMHGPSQFALSLSGSLPA
jgi:hypothetical protein